MKIWKVLIVFALPYFMLGCCKCADYISVTYFSYCSLQVDNIDALNNQLDAVSLADTIDLKQFGIRATIEKSQASCSAPTTIFTTAYACDCVEPNRYIPNNGIMQFRIITLNNFDATHRAGDTINSYFQQFYGPTFLPVDEYVQNYFSSPNNESTYFSDEQIDLKLITAPTNKVKHAFRIEILLSNNRLLSATTREVYLR